jgi:hypothetical protein
MEDKLLYNSAKKSVRERATPYSYVERNLGMEGEGSDTIDIVLK